MSFLQDESIALIIPSRNSAHVPTIIDTYPNYLLVYFNQHVVFSFAWSLICLIYFYKKPFFFSSLKRDIKSLINLVKNLF